MNNRSFSAFFLTFLFTFLTPVGSAWAGFTDTLPKHAFLMDESVIFAWLDSRYDNHGNEIPIIDELERYEPGAGLQGILRPKPEVKNLLLISQLQFGILDNLSFGLGIPVVLKTDIEPNLIWEPGNYQSRLGRSFSGDDFWEWAEAMGQPKPQAFHGNRGQIADLIVGLRYRWTDHIDWFKKKALWDIALMLSGNIPTGKKADPEEVVTIGTTNWDLQTQGDIAVHLGMDKRFDGVLHKKLVLGVDLFYETFFERSFQTPTGEKNPLLLNYEYYVGDRYRLDPGDISGFSLDLAGSPYIGPARPTWIVGHDEEAAKNLPAMIVMSVRYTFAHTQQSNWSSKAPHWDWEREQDYKPGYKNYLQFKATFSLLRFGVPLQIYAAYKSLALIPGKNCRAVDMIQTGVQIPFKLWGFGSKKEEKTVHEATFPGSSPTPEKQETDSISYSSKEK